MRRRRSTFAGSSSLGRVRWLEPVERRQRRRPPVVPILLLLVVLAGAGGVAYVLLARQAATDRREQAAAGFAAAWQKGDYAAMWRLITPERRREWPQAQFTASYKIADEQATVKAVKVGAAGPITGGRTVVPVNVRTRDFGTLRGPVPLKVVDEDGASYLDWSPSWRLPGLRGGENVRRRVLARPARRPILASDGTQLDAEPTLAGIAGTQPAAGEPGSGLEALYDERVGGRPGAELHFGDRVVKRVKVRSGHTLKTTLSPRIQRAATSALGNRVGGVAVIRPRTGSVLAAAGLALNGPQPPGSTFKIVTLSGALQAGIAKPSSSYPVQTGTTLSGVRLANASNESCGGSLATSFAHSCNSVFAPLGAKLGARKLVRLAEAFGFNEKLSLPNLKPSTIARDLKDDLAVGAAAIGQDRDLATALQMASVGATIANRGVRVRPRIVRGERAHRRRVVSRRVAGDVRDMMLGVVRGGTGVAAALPGVDVAGKTGTAELRPTNGGPPDPRNTDAWFVAFAPASRPTVAVAVMLVGAGQGGATAAPIARQVLAASL
jgi:cell division protein FtsI/penicillin-binding protein 2